MCAATTTVKQYVRAHPSTPVLHPTVDPSVLSTTSAPVTEHATSSSVPTLAPARAASMLNVKSSITTPSVAAGLVSLATPSSDALLYQVPTTSVFQNILSDSNGKQNMFEG